MAGLDRKQWRFQFSLLECLGASRSKAAASGPGSRRRDTSPDRAQSLQWTGETGDRCKQSLGVRVRGVGEQPRRFGFLDDLAGFKAVRDGNDQMIGVGKIGGFENPWFRRVANYHLRAGFAEELEPGDVFAGYTIQREVELTPGVSSSASVVANALRLRRFR